MRVWLRIVRRKRNAKRLKCALLIQKVVRGWLARIVTNRKRELRWRSTRVAREVIIYGAARAYQKLMLPHVVCILYFSFVPSIFPLRLLQLLNKVGNDIQDDEKSVNYGRNDSVCNQIKTGKMSLKTLHHILAVQVLIRSCL